MMTVLVADASEAKVFSAENRHATLSEIKHIKNPTGHLLEQELTSDTPGRIMSRGGGSHNYQTAETHKHNDEVAFASLVIRFLRDLYETQSLGNLVILAAPDFLGELRKLMPANIKKHIILEKPRDLVAMEKQEIQAHLHGYFQSEFLNG